MTTSKSNWTRLFLYLRIINIINRGSAEFLLSRIQNFVSLFLFPIYVKFDSNYHIRCLHTHQMLLQNSDQNPIRFHQTLYNLLQMKSNAELCIYQQNFVENYVSAMQIVLEF